MNPPLTVSSGAHTAALTVFNEKRGAIVVRGDVFDIQC